MTGNTEAEALVPKFQYERTLNQDQAGRRTALYGQIDGKPALLVLERAPFPTSPEYLGSVSSSLSALQNLGANDVYFWFMGASGPGGDTKSTADTADLKINLIWPCTPQHVKKYSRQGLRWVTETPEVYRQHVRPFMEAQRQAGRLQWVYNIIEGRTEVEDVIFRTPYEGEAAAAAAPSKGFLLLYDLNWDRRTIEALHLLALVERRDIWSLRDLRRRHLPWLRHMRAQLMTAALGVYGDRLQADQLKLYVHYQPTYYHFHIHIVHVQLEAGATQAVGKAVGLDSIIDQLELMGGRGGSGADDDDIGMDSATLSYTLGEASELWSAVFGPLKEKSEEEQRQKER